MRDFYGEANLDTRVATTVADIEAVQGVPRNVVRDGTMLYVLSTGELLIFRATSTAAAAAGIAYVPTFVSDTEEYQADPATAAGRLLVHSRGLATSTPISGMYLPVRAATTGNLAATLQSDGVTLLANANGALGAIDGVTLAVGDRLLVKAQSAPAANGLYVVVALGDGSNPFTLVRSPDAFIASAIVPEAHVVVLSGTVNAGKEFALVAIAPVTLGTTSITFRPLTQHTSVTLVGGVATLSSVWVTSATGVIVELTTPGGTMGARLKIAKTNGAGSGSVTITAVDASGATVATDTSTLFVKLID